MEIENILQKKSRFGTYLRGLYFYLFPFILQNPSRTVVKIYFEVNLIELNEDKNNSISQVIKRCYKFKVVSGIR